MTVKTSTQPLDMLRKCHAHFVQCAKHYRAKALKAGNVEETNAALDDAVINERYVSQIEATLRDWA